MTIHCLRIFCCCPKLLFSKTDPGSHYFLKNLLINVSNIAQFLSLLTQFPKEQHQRLIWQIQICRFTPIFLPPSFLPTNTWISAILQTPPDNFCVQYLIRDSWIDERNSPHFNCITNYYSRMIRLITYLGKQQEILHEMSLMEQLPHIHTIHQE